MNAETRMLGRKGRTSCKSRYMQEGTLGIKGDETRYRC